MRTPNKVVLSFSRSLSLSDTFLMLLHSNTNATHSVFCSINFLFLFVYVYILYDPGYLSFYCWNFNTDNKTPNTQHPLTRKFSEYGTAGDAWQKWNKDWAKYSNMTKIWSRNTRTKKNQNKAKYCIPIMCVCVFIFTPIIGEPCFTFEHSCAGALKTERKKHTHAHTYI